jgi:hypothetical protein
MPLSLSDEEMALLRSLAEPVAYGRRREFLCEVAATLEAVHQSGPGVLFRVAREVQRKYVVSSQRIDPRHEPFRPNLACGELGVEPLVGKLGQFS